MTIDEAVKKTMNSRDKLMDILQDRGRISDEAIRWHDVPESDQLPALAFLKDYFRL